MYWEYTAKPLTTEQESELKLEYLLDDFETYGIDREEALQLIDENGGFVEDVGAEYYF